VSFTAGNRAGARAAAAHQDAPPVSESGQKADSVLLCRCGASSTAHAPILTADSRLSGRSLIDPLECEGFEGAAA
jgi:hypothetical protein